MQDKLNLKTNKSEKWGSHGLLGKKISPKLIDVRNRRDAAEKAVNEMELTAELREAMERILELHLADRELMYGILEQLTTESAPAS